MELWITTRLEGSASTRMVLEAAKLRGHSARFIHPSMQHLLVSTGVYEQSILSSEQFKMRPDCVFTRLGSSAPASVLYFIKHLEALGLRCVNSSVSLEVSRDKVRCLYALKQAKLPIPQSILISPYCDLKSALESLPGPPWVLKIPVGTQGNGVMLVDSLESLTSVIDGLHCLGGVVLLQEFVRGSRGVDVRVLVAGGEVLASMRRRAQGSEFRANIHRGARPEAYVISKELEELSIKAAKSLGLDVAGVDLLEGENGAVLIEVNGSPGLEGLQTVNRENIADKLIAFLERR